MEEEQVVEEPIPRENAVLVFGATGNLGRVLVKKVSILPTRSIIAVSSSFGRLHASDGSMLLRYVNLRTR